MRQFIDRLGALHAEITALRDTAHGTRSLSAFKEVLGGFHQHLRTEAPNLAILGRRALGQD